MRRGTRVVDLDTDLDPEGFAIPDPDQEIIERREGEDEETEEEAVQQSSNFVNAAGIYNPEFQACIQAMRMADYESSKLLSLIESVSLVIPERHLTEFTEWRKVEEKYGTLKKDAELKPDEFIERWRVILKISKDVGIAGRAAQQGPAANMISFHALCERVLEMERP